MSRTRWLVELRGLVEERPRRNQMAHDQLIVHDALQSAERVLVDGIDDRLGCCPTASVILARARRSDIQQRQAQDRTHLVDGGTHGRSPVTREMPDMPRR